MELKPSDFILTGEQQGEIDRKFSALVGANPAAVVDPYHVVSVTFEFSAHGKLLSAKSQLGFDEEEVFYAAVKPFTQADVALTDSQLREINHRLSEGIRTVLAREGLYANQFMHCRYNRDARRKRERCNQAFVAWNAMTCANMAAV